MPLNGPGAELEGGVQTPPARRVRRRAPARSGLKFKTSAVAKCQLLPFLETKSEVYILLDFVGTRKVLTMMVKEFSDGYFEKCIHSDRRNLEALADDDVYQWSGQLYRPVYVTI